MSDAYPGARPDAPPGQQPGAPPGKRAVLYIHGWSDYFFHTELAAYWHEQGVNFYALDLRKCGRSRLPHQTPGFIEDLNEHNAEIAAALNRIRLEHRCHVAVMLMGHSTGGLIASLWASQHPGELAGLILNSPSLELQGSDLLQAIPARALRELARFSPLSALPNTDTGFYAKSLSNRSDATWQINPVWRPVPSFPIRAGWLRAILDGQAAVAAGLDIDCPVLTLLSSKSTRATHWHKEIHTTDTVLDVEMLAQRAPKLGQVVTVARIHNGIHDLALSLPAPRGRFYWEIGRWLTSYGWSMSPVEADD